MIFTLVNTSGFFMKVGFCAYEKDETEMKRLVKPF